MCLLGSECFVSTPGFDPDSFQSRNKSRTATVVQGLLKLQILFKRVSPVMAEFKMCVFSVLADVRAENLRLPIRANARQAPVLISRAERNL
jgi:hypothetical protein